MRILISGGAGFIGSHLSDALQHGNHRVLVVDDFSTGKSENLAEFLTIGGMVREGDISSYKVVSQIFQDFKPEAVIHLAAQAAISTSIENPVRDLTVNGIGTLNMLMAANIFAARHFVLASTSAVYREMRFFKTKEDSPLGPNTPYGVSKLAAEMYTRSMFPNAVILRFGNVYGPRQVPIGENQLISRMIRHFKYGDRFVIHGSGSQQRDFVYVSDVVKALTYAIYEHTPGTYNIANGQATSVNEISRLVESYYGVPGYKWDHTEREDPRKRACLEIGAAARGLNWRPKVNIVDGVRMTCDWWEQK